MQAADLPGYDREFVFVDDGSDDGSLQELLGLRAADPTVRVISFTRNFGQMAAILAAYEALWPRPDAGTSPDDLPRWRFAGRWWSARPRYGGWT